ncbi:MAG: YebC/PmpR family DNA-binding transcriptional regulator [Patescibacteria group bacterium]
MAKLNILLIFFMSGHSKWAKIKRQKGTADAKRSDIFTKHAKNIAIAAKNGKDPEMNPSLKTAINSARTVNMPKANIEKAILRGAGEMPGQELIEATYEGYGSNGVALFIETITDNKNRTTSFIKSVLNKFGGSLGGPNSTAYMFNKKGVIRIESADEDFQLKAIDAGADDVVEEEGGLTIYTSPQDLDKVKTALGKVDFADIDMIPETKADLNDKAKETVSKMIDELEENEDINNVYTNADL